MADTISSMVNEARQVVDDAYALDPNQDFEALKATFLWDRLYGGTDYASILTMAGQDPTPSFSDGGVAAAADAYATMSGKISAAMDDELNTLQNP